MPVGAFLQRQKAQFPLRAVPRAFLRRLDATGDCCTLPCSVNLRSICRFRPDPALLENSVNLPSICNFCYRAPPADLSTCEAGVFSAQ